MKTVFFLLALLAELSLVTSFSSIAVAAPIPKVEHSDTTFVNEGMAINAAVPVPKRHGETTYEDAVQIIDKCVVEEKINEDLYDAVRLIEKRASKFYPDIDDREDLWERAQGCWKLVFSSGSGKNRSFHPPKYLFPFSFAMITGDYFGNGFGLGPDNIWVSVLQKNSFNPKIRQLVVTVLDIYLGGNKATKFIPDVCKEAINLGKSPDDFREAGKKPPAFCIVAASEHTLIARGNQSGALAIWKRLPKDIQPVAYKDLKV